jgi:hypothetical protein
MILNFIKSSSILWLTVADDYCMDFVCVKPVIPGSGPNPSHWIRAIIPPEWNVLQDVHGISTIFGAGRLPPGCSIFSITYNPVEAADSKPPFFRFEFVNHVCGERPLTRACG